MTTVTVKTRQIRMALNNPDAFILALVKVPTDCRAETEVRYLHRPFTGIEPGFAEVSRTFDLDLLWDRGSPPRRGLVE